MEPEALDFQRRETCLLICEDIVEAVQTYTDVFGYHKPTGYMLTSALVESLYWVEHERQQLRPVVPEAKLEYLKGLTGKLLQDLALNIGAAARAYESLSALLSTDSSAFDSQKLGGPADFQKSISDAQKPQREIRPLQGNSLALSFEGTCLAGETELLPDLDGLQGFLALNAEDLVESAFDISSDVDWNALVNSFPSAGTAQYN